MKNHDFLRLKWIVDVIIFITDHDHVQTSGNFFNGIGNDGSWSSITPYLALILYFDQSRIKKHNFLI